MFNVIGAPIAGKTPLELIRVYLTFPLGEKALELSNSGQGGYAVGDGVILAIGCCLYLATGMLLGIPIYLALTRFAARGGLIVRLAVATVVSLGDLGVQLLRGALVAAAAPGRGRPWQLDHQPQVSSLVGRGGNARGFRLDDRPSLFLGRLHAVSTRKRRESSVIYLF